MRIQQNLQPINLRRGFKPQAERPNEPQEQVHLSKDPGGPRAPKPWGKILLKTAISTGFGALMGAGMAGGGIGSFIVGGIAGSSLGMSVIGPMGNGKGADGLLYAGAGLVLGGIGGALVGYSGLPHGAAIGAATFGLVALGKALTKD